MRCQHCYDDIREATITETSGGMPFIHDVVTEVGTTWLTESTRSPFCLRAPCSTGVVHEIKHVPMPQV